MIPSRQILEKVERFLFPAVSDRWLTILRIGLGLQVTLYCLSLRSAWGLLFSEHGSALIERKLTEAILDVYGPLIPRLGWLIPVGQFFALSEETMLFVAWIGLLSAGICLVLGLFSRSAAIVGWFVHLCSIKSGYMMSYGVDNFTTIGLFYLMLSPLPDGFSLDRMFWRRKPKDPHILGFFRRVLQLHLCIIYFFGGLMKCLGSGWWNGTSLWRSLVCPPFNVLPVDLVFSWKHFLPVLGIGVVVLEMGYCFFIWPRQTRVVWLVAILAMHLATGLGMGLYLFALIMIILNVAAFGADLIPSKGRDVPAFPMPDK